MKTRKYGFGLLDIIVTAILLIIVAIFAYVCFFDSIKEVAVHKDKFDITFQVTEINSNNAQLIKSGKSISLTDDDNYSGTIKSVKFYNAGKEYVNKANNTSKTYPISDVENATLLVEFEGTYSHETVNISGQKISVGNSVVLNTPEISFNARIIKIEKR